MDILCGIDFVLDTATSEPHFGFAFCWCHHPLLMNKLCGINGLCRYNIVAPLGSSMETLCGIDFVATAPMDGLLECGSGSPHRLSQKSQEICEEVHLLVERKKNGFSHV
jgi:hypothetical protein